MRRSRQTRRRAARATGGLQRRRRKRTKPGRTTWAPACAALLVAAGCLAPSPEAPSDPAEPGTRASAAPQRVSSALAAEALEAAKQYYAALSARDWEAFAACFWPDATLTTVWQPAGEDAPRVFTTTVPEFVARAPEGPDSQPIFREELVTADVRAAGDVAQVWAHYRAAFGTEDELREWSGIDAISLMKHGGRWRITSIAFAAVR